MTAPLGRARAMPVKAIGVITPSANLVVERVTAAVLADFPEVSAHYSRTPVRGAKDSHADDYDLDGMLGATRLLGDAALDAIVWNGSKGASIGFAHDRALVAAIEAETGMKATTSMLAIEAELDRRGITRVGVVSPYRSDYQDQLIATLEGEGLTVVSEAHVGIADNLAFMRVSRGEIATLIGRVAAARPQAILTLCTNFPRRLDRRRDGGRDRDADLRFDPRRRLRRAHRRRPRSATGARLGAAVRRGGCVVKTLFRRVTLLDPTTGDGRSAETDVLVAGDTIAAVGPDLGAAIDATTRVIEGRDRLLMPGLVNAHFHSPVNHMKGRLPSLPLEVFMLYESPAIEALKPSPREAYVRTLLAAMEMLKTGTTAVQDDAFFVPNPTPELIDAVAQAYADCGIRATLGLDQPELPEADKLPFLLDLVPPELRDDLTRVPAFGRAELLAAYDHLFARWHGAADGRIRAATSISAPQRVSPEYFAALDDLSRRHGTPIWAHILETKLQRVLAGAHPRFEGRSLVRYTADLGLLSERMNIIHAIWVDDADLDLIAAAGSVIAHNPISNSAARLGGDVVPPHP